MASTRIHIDEARLGRVQKQDRIATGVLTAIAAIVMLIVISMVAYILFEGVSTLFQPGFLTQPSRANGTQGGVLYQLFDSFYLLLITLIISVPISLGGAVFLVEYAPNGPSATSPPLPSRRCPRCPPSLSACSVSWCSRCSWAGSTPSSPAPSRSPCSTFPSWCA